MAWHLALNHASLPSLKIWTHRGILKCIHPHTFKDIHRLTCTGCAAGKTKAAPHRPTKHTKWPTGSALSTETMGPFTPTSSSGHRNILLTTDVASRYAIASLLRQKSEAAQAITQTLTWVANHKGRHTNTLRTDNAKELTRKHVTSFLRQHGITDTRTIPKKPQENGIVERLNQTIINAVRSALAHSRLPPEYWDVTAIDAVYKYNHVPHTSTGQPPVFLWDKQYQHPPLFLPFGTIGTINYTRPKKKLEQRALRTRYLQPQTHDKIIVEIISSKKRIKCRLRDFTPHHPTLGPCEKMYHAFRQYRKQTTPENITASTPAPAHLKKPANTQTTNCGPSHTIRNSANWKNERNFNGSQQPP